MSQGFDDDWSKLSGIIDIKEIHLSPGDEIVIAATNSSLYWENWSLAARRQFSGNCFTNDGFKMPSTASTQKTLLHQPALIYALSLGFLPWLLAVVSALICPGYYRALFVPPFEKDSKIILEILLSVLVLNTTACVILAKSRNRLVWALVIAACIIPSIIIFQVLPHLSTKIIGENIALSLMA